MLPGAMRSAPLWPTRLSVWHPGHQKVVRLSSPWPRGWIERRAAARARAARPCRRCAGSASAMPSSADALHARAALRATIAQRLLVGDLAGRAPRVDARREAALDLPQVADAGDVRWSSSASPIGRVGSSSRSRRRKRRSSKLGREDVGAEAARCAGRSGVRDSVISSSTGPSNWTTSRSPRAQHEPGARAASAASAGRAARRATSRSCAGASGSSGRPRSAGTGACRGRRRPAPRGRRAARASGRGAKRGCGVRELVGHVALEHRADPVRRVVDRVALGHRAQGTDGAGAADGCSATALDLVASRAACTAASCWAQLYPADRPRWSVRPCGGAELGLVRVVGDPTGDARTTSCAAPARLRARRAHAATRPSSATCTPHARRHRRASTLGRGAQAREGELARAGAEAELEQRASHAEPTTGSPSTRSSARRLMRPPADGVGERSERGRDALVAGVDEDLQALAAALDVEDRLGAGEHDVGAGLARGRAALGAAATSAPRRRAGPGRWRRARSAARRRRRAARAAARPRRAARTARRRGPR